VIDMFINADTTMMIIEWEGYCDKWEEDQSQDFIIQSNKRQENIHCTIWI